MPIASSRAGSSPQVARNYDGMIIASYCVFAAFVLTALFFDSIGPGNNDAVLALLTALP